MSKKTTEKGPKPLRGIRNPDLYPQLSNDLATEIGKIHSQVAYQDYKARTGNMGYDVLQQPGGLQEQHYDPSDPMFKLGQSTWDDNVMMNVTPEDMQDARAENQAWWSKWGSGALKMLGTAGTTFADNTVGLLAGITQGIGNLMDDDEKTGFIDGIWNNKITNAMADISESLEEALPNYQSQWEQNAAFYEKLIGNGAANFWANDIMKNAGFTIGAAASIYAMGAVGGVLKGAKGLGTLGKALKLTNAVGDMTKAGKVAHFVGNAVASTIGEASTEALNTYRDNKKLMDLNVANRRNTLRASAYKEYQDSLNAGVNPEYAEQALQNKLLNIDVNVDAYKDKQEKTLLDSSNAVLAANMAVLTISNSLSLGSLIKGGYGNAKSLLLRATKTVDGKPVTSTSDIARGMLNGNLQFEALLIKNGAAKVAGRYMLDATQEGLEEGAQNLASATALINAQGKMNKWARKNSTLGSMINPDATEEVADFTKALGKAYEENFGGGLNSQGFTEVAAGFISGALGVASVHRNKEGKLRPTWQGGLKEAHESVYGELKATEEAIGQMNKALTSGDFGARVRNAVQNMAIKSKQDEALKNGDTMGFKNAEVELLVSNALYARDLGLVDSYMLMFDEMSKGVSDNDVTELRTMASELAKQNGGESSKSLMDSLSDDEIKERYQEKAKSAKEKLQTALDEYDRADELYGDRFSDETRRFAVQEITYKNTLLWDTYRRIEQLDKEADELRNKGDKITPSELEVLKLKAKASKDLQKQASLIRESLNEIKSSPEKLDNAIKSQLTKARKMQAYKEADKAIAKYNEANTLQDMVDVYVNSPEERRAEDLKNAIEKSLDTETKDKLAKFKNYMEDVTVMEDLITRQFPLNNEKTLEDNMQKQLAFTSILHQTVDEMLLDETPSLNRLTLKDKLNQKVKEWAEELKKHTDNSKGLTLDEEGNVDWDKALKDGVVDMNYFALYIDEETNEEKLKAGEKANDMARSLYAAEEIKGMIDDLTDIIGKIDKIDELRKAAPKPKPENSPRGKSEEGKGNKGKGSEGSKVVTSQEGEEITVGLNLLDDSEDDDDWLKNEDNPDDADDPAKQAVTLNPPAAKDKDKGKGKEPKQVLTPEEAKVYKTKDEVGKSGIEFHPITDIDMTKSKSWGNANTFKKKQNEISKAFIGLKNAVASQGFVASERQDVEAPLKNLLDLIDKNAIAPNLMKLIDKYLKESVNKAVLDKALAKKAAPIHKGSSKNVTLEDENESLEKQTLAKTTTSLNGTTNPDYVKSKLKQGIAIEYTPEGHLQEWLHKQGIYPQDFNDMYMKYIMKRDAHKDVNETTNVYYLHHSDRPKDIILAIKYDDVKDIVGTITVSNKPVIINGTLYIVIGNLGYDAKYRPNTKTMFNNLLQRITENHTSEGWYVSDKVNKIKDMTGGHIIKQTSSDTIVSFRNLKDVIENVHRNPDNIKEGTFRWLVIEGNEENGITMKKIGVDEEKDTTYDVKDGKPGLVFLYIPTTKGDFVPIYIETVFLKDAYDIPEIKESEWFKTVQGYISTLADPELSMEEKKKVMGPLKDFLIFSRANLIHVNDESWKSDPNSICATINGVYTKIIDFNEETTGEENIAKLNELLDTLNPRINFKTGVLENNPNFYLDAGLMVTDVAMLKTQGSEIFVYPIDENEDFVINAIPEKVEKPTFNSRLRIYLQGDYYYYDGENFYDRGGDKITGSESTILDTAYKIANGVIKATKTDNATYYKDGASMFVNNGHGGFTLLSKEEAAKAEEVIKKYKAKKRREAAAKKKAEEEKLKKELGGKEELGGKTELVVTNSNFLNEMTEKFNLHTAAGLMEAMNEAKTLDELATLKSFISESSVAASLELLYDLHKVSLSDTKKETPEEPVIVEEEEVELGDFDELGNDDADKGDNGNTSEEKKNFVNGTNMELLKSHEDLEKEKKIVTFAKLLDKEENMDKMESLYDLLVEKFGFNNEDPTSQDIVDEVIKQGYDVSSNDIDTVIDNIKKCK